MEKDNNLDNLLSSIRTNERVKANPFLFARIQARMQRSRTETPPFFLRPAVALPALALLLIFNIATIIHLAGNKPATEEAGISAQLEQQYFSDQTY